MHCDVVHLIKRSEQIGGGLEILLQCNHAIFGAFAEETHNILRVLKKKDDNYVHEIQVIPLG